MQVYLLCEIMRSIFLFAFTIVYIFARTKRKIVHRKSNPMIKQKPHRLPLHILLDLLVRCIEGGIPMTFKIVSK